MKRRLHSRPANTMASSTHLPPSDGHNETVSPRLVIATLFDTYTTRIMLTLAVSLLVVTVAFHLPIDRVMNPIGWQSLAALNQPTLEVIDINTRETEPGEQGILIATLGLSEEVVVEERVDDAANEEQDESESEPLPSPTAPPPIEKLEVRQVVLDFADVQPDIEGGLGAYYIHIEYPQKAIDKGIEGQLILAFVVETDGKPSNVEILRSLHPLCDSSAVRALRQTRFIPGRQNGEPVRVRMKLPVRFTIVDPTPADSTQTGPISSNSL